MRQYTFRELQTNTSWLKELPIEVVRYGKVFVTLYGNPQESNLRKQCELNKEYIKHLEEEVKQLRAELKSLKSEKIIQKNKKDQIGRSVEDFLQGAPLTKAPHVKCQWLGCNYVGELEYGTVYGAWDEKAGEYQKSKGWLCPKHKKQSEAK
ncbi:MAG: hypothetical protein ACOX6V_05090 [Patescibacteria group bacterium]|jgi:hypothetical protein